MYFFLFLLFPLVFAAYCFVKKDKKIIPSSAIGFLAGVLLCAIKLFFSFAHRIIPYSFGENFAYYFVRMSFLPAVVLYGLFFLISRDSADYKIKNAFPLLACFYMVYLPYTTIASAASAAPAFMIFVVPVIYLAMVGQISITAKYAYKNFTDKNIPLLVASIAIIIVYLVLPAVIESLYMIGFNLVILSFISLIYSLIPAAYIVLKFLEVIKSE